MSRFNTKNTDTNKTTNLAGGEAYSESPKLELVSVLLTSFVKDQFYRSADDTVQRVVELMHQIPDKKFAAKAAIYARKQYGMRSISHVVAGTIASTVKGEQWTKNFFDKVINRPDDMTEILAYYYAQGNKNEPNSLKKGFAQAFARFDAYQLGKYRKEGSAVSLIDVANLVHPKHSEAISQLIKGTLPTPKTWEAELSKAGQNKDEGEKEEAKKEVWVELVKTRKIGYFALLRNLRNILEQSPEILPDALELLVDANLIRKSLVLPFRFITAIDEIQKLNGNGVAKVLVALNQAVGVSLQNVPKFDGDTLVAVDGSGSMQGDPAKIASLFAAVIMKSNQADLMVFASDARYATYNPLDSTLTIAKLIQQAMDGGGTNFHAIFQNANRKYDRIFILSDMQGWIGYDNPSKDLAQYKTRVGANPRIYSFDLQGLGTLQFPENNVFALAGFSDKTMDVIKMLEQDRNALITEIEKIEL